MPRSSAGGAVAAVVRTALDWDWHCLPVHVQPAGHSGCTPRAHGMPHPKRSCTKQNGICGVMIPVVHCLNFLFLLCVLVFFFYYFSFIIF